MVIRSIQQDEITITKKNAPKHGAPNFMKQILIEIKDHIDINAHIEGNLNMPLSGTDTSGTREISALKQTFNQMTLVDLYYRVSDPTIKYTFLMATHSTFFQIDHILIDKACLYEYKRIKILLCILSDHYAMNKNEQ